MRALQVSYALQAQELMVSRAEAGVPDHAVAGSHAAGAAAPTALNEDVTALGMPADCCCLAVLTICSCDAPAARSASLPAMSWLAAAKLGH